MGSLMGDVGPLLLSLYQELAALLWAVGRLDQMPPYYTVVGLVEMDPALTTIIESVHSFVTYCELRTQSELRTEMTRIAFWYWRAFTTMQDESEGKSPEELIVAETWNGTIRRV